MYRVIIKYHSHKFDEYQNKDYDTAIVQALEALKCDYGHSVIIDVCSNDHHKKTFLVKRHPTFLSVSQITKGRRNAIKRKR